MSLILRPTASAGTVTASAAYSSGNVVGSLITFSNAVRAPGQGGIIHSAFLHDLAGQAGTYDLFLFKLAPTAQTNKTAIALTAADNAKLLGVISFAAVSLGAASTQGISSNLGTGFTFKCDTTSMNLFGILVTRGTPTYVGTTDVSIDLSIIPDGP